MPLTVGGGLAGAAWPAPLAEAPVRARVEVPGSKSVTARALVLAALASAPSTLRAPLVARDTRLMVGGLRALGAAIDTSGEVWTVTPADSTLPAGTRIDVAAGARIEVGLSGTVMRFLPPVAALRAASTTFDGDPRARQRPLGALIAALRGLGVRVDDAGRGALPLTVHGTGHVSGGSLVIDASASSQLVSGLLLSAPRFDNGLDLRHRGGPLPSLPHVRMTVAMLRIAGAEVGELGPNRWRVAPGPLRGLDLTIEPDLSNAAPFLAAAMVTGGRVTVAGWPASTTQPGDRLRELLTAMGGRCELTGAGLTVTGPDRLTGLDADLREASELVPVLAAIAAVATTPTRLRGVGHMRGHETDRLAALTTELTRLGGRVRETGDGLEITPAPLRGAPIATYHDHRMAQFAAVLGLVVPNVAIVDVATTAKTMPDFTDRWLRMLAA